MTTPAGSAGSAASAEPPIDVFAGLVDPAVRADPSRFYQRVREELPVHRHRSGAYLVSTFELCKWAFQSPLLRSPTPEEIPVRFPRTVKHRSIMRLYTTIAFTGPPEHTRLRRLIGRDFTVAMIERRRPDIERHCDALIDGIEEPLRDGQSVDFHAQLATPITVSTLSDILGVPEDRRQELLSHAANTISAANMAATEEMLDAADASTDFVDAFYLELIDRVRREPADDLTSLMVAAHDADDDKLSRHELQSMLWGLWTGGHTTTAAQLDCMLYVMFAHPDQTRMLEGSPTEVRAFTDEVLRYRAAAMVSSVARIATEDIKVGDVVIPEGSDVRALPACANRDGAAFRDADRFDPLRTDGDTLAFGHGIHYCVGAALARVTAQVVARRVHERLPNLVAAGPEEPRLVLPVDTFDRVLVALDG
jgi:cytochrome P450 family 114